MKRLAFLLGCFSVGGQVLLLRELLAAFGGDELLLGTAFCGWLSAVALGAWLGGRAGSKTRPLTLFIGGAIILPMTLLAVRLSPAILATIPGEAISFPLASLASILLMLPVAAICGALFPAISNLAIESREAILTVYLWEGIGAFAGGLLSALLLGGLLTTMATVLLLALITVLAALWFCRGMHKVILAVIALLAGAAAVLAAPKIDLTLAAIRFSGYEVQAVFDTRYSHQVILTREESYYLVTDNIIESSYPDLESAENLLLPGLLYYPEAREVLLLGGAELALMPLLDSFPSLRTTQVDPRANLMRHLETLSGGRKVTQITADPLDFVRNNTDAFDLILLNPGAPDNLRQARLLDPSFLARLAARLTSHGILQLQLPYDSERYVSPTTQPPLVAVADALRSVFPQVTVWPGATTTFFAARENALNLPVDSLLHNLSALPYAPVYLTESRLRDRLEPMRRERLASVLQQIVTPYSLDRPLLPHYQLAQRAEAGFVEQTLVRLVTTQRMWLLPLGVLLLLFWFRSTNPKQPWRYSTWLFWLCGFVSLSLEL
ncbi:MAG: hypothetical protein ABIJ61_03205, partial [bacterium]